MKHAWMYILKCIDGGHSCFDLESRRQGMDSRFRGNDVNALMEVIPDLIRNPGKGMDSRFRGNDMNTLMAVTILAVPRIFKTYQ